MAEDTKQPSAVYVAWASFKGAIEKLSHGMPTRIDKSVFVGQSFSVQHQLVAAFKFLTLISDSGEPSAELSALVAADEDGKKKLMAKIMRSSYTHLFAMDLTKTTPDQFREAIAKHGVGGETREKATRFFLQAAMWAGIPLSPLLTKKLPKSNAGSPRPARSSRKRRPKDPPPAPPLISLEPPAAGTSKVINLRSGGTLTLSADMDLFKLDQADRAFVFALIDKLDEYNAANDAASKEDEP